METTKEVQIYDSAKQASSELEELREVIRYRDLIYQFVGVSTLNDFNTYQPSFSTTFTNFRRLTDPSKINVKPERVIIKNVPRDMALSEVLNYYRMPKDRHEELSILNSMQLTDKVAKGTLIKVFGK